MELIIDVDETMSVGGGRRNLKKESQKRVKDEEIDTIRDKSFFMWKGERKLCGSWRSVRRMFCFAFNIGYIKACFPFIEIKYLKKIRVDEWRLQVEGKEGLFSILIRRKIQWWKNDEFLIWILLFFIKVWKLSSLWDMHI